MSLATKIVGRLRGIFRGKPEKPVTLKHFEDIWPVELEAIDRRRREAGRDSLRRLRPSEAALVEMLRESERRPPSGEETSRARSPNPDQIFDDNGAFRQRRPLTAIARDPRSPDGDKMRPQPVPCNATGLAFSGGGIRSAAVCLGALQALSGNGRIASIDYLSTVSGGGYIGACLSAAMSRQGGRLFPFGSGFVDGPAVAHLRNFSNYLMPRGQSRLRNGAEAAAVILRGLLANFVIVFTLILAAALITKIAYPDATSLASGSFLLRFVVQIVSLFIAGYSPKIPAPHFLLTLIGAGVLAIVLLAWAAAKSVPTRRTGGDTRGPMLAASWLLLSATAALAFLELQPFLLGALLNVHYHLTAWGQAVAHWGKLLSAGLTAFAGAVSAASSALGHFLKKSERASGSGTIALRLAAQLALLVAASVMPLAIWAVYLSISAALVVDSKQLDGVWWAISPYLPRLPYVGHRPPAVEICLVLWAVGTVISLGFGPNGYSLHRFYRDRLSKAFLFRPRAGAPAPLPLDGLKLSDLRDSDGPYHIINAAMNVQGSAAANKRGRDADFFIFTRDFIGSDLTMYSDTHPGPGLAPTLGMEAVDPALNLGTALAISGAAISANMGSKTNRSMSPTLALLNIRLGYWLRNPRDLAARSTAGLVIGKFLRRFTEKFFLLAEILNLHDETKPVVFLTDGGHIENLGLYELLKRGCETIIVVDAEADPEMAFPSLLKLERYARIDFGIRIVLPWEKIADISKRVAKGLADERRPCWKGPHCAVGRILYADGCEGTLIYFKSSVTGDEKDYILDYKRRKPSFPHETTGDQFFSEEQFEMYRALGFHMVDGFFSREDSCSFVRSSGGGFPDGAAIFAALDASIPAGH